MKNLKNRRYKWLADCITWYFYLLPLNTYLCYFITDVTYNGFFQIRIESQNGFIIYNKMSTILHERHAA